MFRFLNFCLFLEFSILNGNSSFASAPQVSPARFSGFNTSSTSIGLSWDPIPQEQVAGVLTNFYITYRQLSSADNTTHSLAVPITNLSFELTNLRKYTNYSLQVKGATKFIGIPTEPIIITTDEDGKELFLLFTVTLIICQCCRISIYGSVGSRSGFELYPLKVIAMVIYTALRTVENVNRSTFALQLPTETSFLFTSA